MTLTVTREQVSQLRRLLEISLVPNPDLEALADILDAWIDLSEMPPELPSDKEIRDIAAAAGEDVPF